MNDTIMDAVTRAWSDQGDLTTAEIRKTPNLPQGIPQDLRPRVPATDDDVAKGPPEAGVLVAGARDENRPAEAVGDSPAPKKTWEEETDEWLAHHLVFHQLAKLLGPFFETMKRERRTMTRSDRRFTRMELATALRRRHGLELLCDPDVRKALAMGAGVAAPGRWQPGRRSAVAFVVAVGLPRELAGTANQESVPNVRILRGRPQLPRLLDFQNEVKVELERTLRSRDDRAIYAAFTGTGKTRVAIEAIRDTPWDLSGATDPGDVNTVLWLAHTDELCEQPCVCFEQVWESSEGVETLELVRYWGNHARDLARTLRTLESPGGRLRVLVSTPQRLAQLLAKSSEVAAAVVRMLSRNLVAIVVDEAHRWAAPSYRRILEVLSPPVRPVPVIGLTATPFRNLHFGRDPGTGTTELKEIFRRLIEADNTLGASPRATLEEMGVLARPKFETIPTKISMWFEDEFRSDRITEEDMKRLDRRLASLADNDLRRFAIFRAILPIARCRENSILYFGPSVQDAELMAALLRRHGIEADVVSGMTRVVTRRRAVAGFCKKHRRVLCTCDALTTGFDAPVTTHVVMARPTVSLVLYRQMIGRGLRGPLFGGTATCTILDCEDDYPGGRPDLGYEQFRRFWEGE
jgi:superfamily II DNA or RNA helicase